MILASILITSDGRIPSPLPRIVRENIDSFKSQHEGIEHTLFDGTMIRDFLSTNFDATVVGAYDELRPYAYKADLARYCILYKLGGVYCDLSFMVMAPFLPIDGKLAIFRDVGPTSPWDAYNGLIAAPAGHKALLKSIEMICDNVKHQYYGTTPVCPTGPTLFGKAIALTCEPEDLIVGEVFRPPGMEAFNCLIDMTTRTVIAVNRKKTVGTVESLGIVNGNNYNDLWHAENVYQTEVKRSNWSARWLHGRRYTRGTLDGDVLLLQGSKSGAIIWGPYAHLSPGEYVASVVADGTEAYGDFQMDIATGQGKEILAEGSANSLTREPFRSTLSFSLTMETPAVEVRLHAGGPHKISLKEVQLEKRGA